VRESRHASKRATTSCAVAGRQLQLRGARRRAVAATVKLRHPRPQPVNVTQKEPVVDLGRRYNRPVQQSDVNKQKRGVGSADLQQQVATNKAVLKRLEWLNKHLQEQLTELREVVELSDRVTALRRESSEETVALRRSSTTESDGAYPSFQLPPPPLERSTSGAVVSMTVPQAPPPLTRSESEPGTSDGASKADLTVMDLLAMFENRI